MALMASENMTVEIVYLYVHDTSLFLDERVISGENVSCQTLLVRLIGHLYPLIRDEANNHQSNPLHIHTHVMMIPSTTWTRPPIITSRSIS